MIFLIWLIGYMFTIGFHRPNKTECEIPVFFAFLTFVMWPIVLGDDLRKTLS
jgi:hypothetical protein